MPTHDFGGNTAHLITNGNVYCIGQLRIERDNLYKMFNMQSVKHIVINK